jgi:hypothetical protein
MIPNALKLSESVEETAVEVPDRPFDFVLIPASSGTIAAGVIRGFSDQGLDPTYIVHLGYSRSHKEVITYLAKSSGVAGANIQIVDEGYRYKDESKPGDSPPWPCNTYYDMKAFRWWLENRADYIGSTLFWNVG